MICERLLKEREEKVREEYEETMTSKLAGWYIFDAYRIFGTKTSIVEILLFSFSLFKPASQC